MTGLATPADDGLPDEVRELVSRCLRGDQSSMAALVERFQGQVFGLCYRMLGHRQDAEDVTQESFSRALRSLKSWDNQRAFRPWLMAIAGNRCRTWLATRVRRHVSAEDLTNVPDRAPDLDRARNLAEEVALALSQLRPEYQRCFSLFHCEQLSYLEIAAALVIPVGTAKTWVHRARRELADSLRRRGVVQELPNEVR